MNDTIESQTQEDPAHGRWLMLIHRLPPKPDYLRVKVRRRLQRIGAVALKSTVYLLPPGAEQREDFEWLRREIMADGGEATLWEAAVLEGPGGEGIEAAFRRERDAEYAELAAVAETAGEADVARLKRQLAAVVGRDHFGAAGRAAAEAAIARLAAGSHPGGEPGGGAVAGPRPSGATWVTRRDVGVDRMGSAWLIRRFVDPGARFRFVSPRGHRPEPGEVRFDMYEGEYTHEGGRCTFEVLAERFVPEDAALRAMAEVVHDVDLKEERYGRPEAEGIAVMVRGLTLAHAVDDARIEAGSAVFDALYAHFRGRSK